jgi:hypothetical protein
LGFCWNCSSKGLGAIRAKIGPTSDVDKIFSKMYSQYVLFQKAETVANVLLNEWFYVYGVPERLHSDQGRNFESNVIRQFHKLYVQVLHTHRTIHSIKH